MKSFGSRGEQRLAVFTMKMVELEYISDKTQQRPILLLDDIFSELDDSNRELVTETIQKQQTVMTTAEQEVVDLLKGTKMDVLRLG
jgi:DNA replication and repair protein RecF